MPGGGFGNGAGGAPTNFDEISSSKMSKKGGRKKFPGIDEEEEEEGGCCQYGCCIWIVGLVILWTFSGIWALYLQFQAEKRDMPLVIATLFIVLALMLMSVSLVSSRPSDDDEEVPGGACARKTMWTSYFFIVLGVVFVAVKLTWFEGDNTGPAVCRRLSDTGFYRFADDTCFTGVCPDGQCAVFQHQGSDCATNCYNSSVRQSQLYPFKGIIQNYDATTHTQTYNFTPSEPYMTENSGWKLSATILTSNISSDLTGTITYQPCNADITNCSMKFNTDWLDSTGNKIEYRRRCAQSGSLLSASPALLSSTPSLLAKNGSACPDTENGGGPWGFTLAFDTPLASDQKVHVFLKLVEDPDTTVTESLYLPDATAIDMFTLPTTE